MQSKFLQIPDFETVVLYQKPFRRGVRLKDDLVYRSRIYGSDIVVKEGTLSDGASVPQMFWDRFPPFGRYMESAVVHDEFCVLAKRGQSSVDFIKAAKIFREAMKAQKVSWLTRNCMYQAVRWFGPRFQSN
ncbi:MAG: DUF1353 domain-containing protein [Verrucomicrobiota bacterium]